MEGVPSHVLWYGLLEESVLAPLPVELFGSELCLLGQTPPVVEPDELDGLGDGLDDLCELVREAEAPAEPELDELELVDELEGSDEADESDWLLPDELVLPCPWLLADDDEVPEDPEPESDDEPVEPESDEVDELVEDPESEELDESGGGDSFFACPGGEWSELPVSELATGANPTVGCDD
jgi:hypothetical protein